MVSFHKGGRQRLSLLTVALAVALVVTACGVSQPGGNGSMDQVVVQVREHPEYGTILVDGEGMTLYVYADDEAGTSHCTDACAETWPPLEASDEVAAGENVPGEVDRFERDDGRVQVAYEGMPLYYFTGDEEPGDANGHRLKGEWFVVRLENFE